MKIEEAQMDYWEECIAESAEEHGVELTEQQIKLIAEDVRISHENFSLAFHTPPTTDRTASVEREWEEKYDRPQKRFDDFRERYDKSIKSLAGLSSHAQYRILDNGDVEVLRP